MAPTSSNKFQLKTTLIKAKTSLGHLQRSSLSPQAKWIATQTVVSPGITYPLMATYYNPNDLSKIENVMDQMQCSALGLNCNFPRALLHGPLCLGVLMPLASHQKEVFWMLRNWPKILAFKQKQFQLNLFLKVIWIS